MYKRILCALLVAAAPLLTACEKSPKQARRELVEKGYSYARDDFAKALTEEDGDAVSLFLLAGMDVHAVSGGYIALEHAASSHAMVTALLAAGADPDINGGVTTPLSEAAARGSVATVELLLQRGADPNLGDATDSTPLMAASKRGDIAIVNALLAAGADPNRRSSLGSTALALARAANRDDIATALDRAGATQTRGPDLAALMDPSQLDEAAPARYAVHFSTSTGNFRVEVQRAWAPNAADRFYNLVKHGFFDDQRFFRVVPKRLVQFGLHGLPEVASRWYDATLPDDDANLLNERGTLAFASGDTPNSRTTQIFVNLSDNGDFDDMGFVPFARVIEGMEAVEQIHAGYGEVPQQTRILREGNGYLQRRFPDLDLVVEARLAED